MIDNTRGVPLHPSHDTEMTEDGADPHNPGWRCRICWEYQCVFCAFKPDSPLALPCEGE